MEDMEVRERFWNGKSVFVTGSTGMVGLNMVTCLVDMGAEVVILVRDWVPKIGVPGGTAAVVRGDLTDYDVLERILSEYDIEYVFHLGAQTLVQTGQRSPLTTFKSNVMGTWNLLEAVRKAGDDITAVCCASSDKAYGTAKSLPYTEDMPLEGMSPYEASKSCVDIISRAYASTYNLPVTVARMGNIYGPGDINFGRIVPGTIRALLQGKRPVIRSDGTPVREYFFVEDACDAYFTLAEKIEASWGEAFNFSSGEKLSVLEVVGRITNAYNRLCGTDIMSDPIIQNTSKHEIQEQYLSIEKAGRLLEWGPKWKFEGEALDITIEWYERCLR